MPSTSATVYVTGASRGLGLAIVEKLLGDGVNVVTLQRTHSTELKALEKKYSNTLVNIIGSVTDTSDNETAVSKALERFGRLDAVVLNAGMGVMGTAANTELPDWKAQFEVNFFGVVAGMLAAVPALRESKLTGGGRVIISGSVGGDLAPPGLAAYAASKAAVNSLARSLKNEEPSITAVSVHPGLVATDMVRELLRDGKEKVPAPIYNYFEAGMNAEKSGVTGGHASVPPEVPAKTFAWLALNAPKELNGKFVTYNDEEVAKQVEAST
ncbi:NAD(P)-binding protein [Auriculariales sp. MPI-PUGE-AT-0066]|nr:NAD(P)-binding protein [Auriculariales sp. MPI-PUGE-AT-0066]